MEESNSNNNIANNVARAIVAALDWNSTPGARKDAVSFLESIKTGDVRVLASTSFVLVKRDCSSEIRLHAFKMLQESLLRIISTLQKDRLRSLKCTNKQAHPSFQRVRNNLLSN